MLESLKSDIEKMEFASQVIEPDAATRKKLLGKVNAYTEGFLERIHDRPAFIETEDKGRGLYDSPFSEDPLDIDSVLKLFRENVEEQGLSPVSGKFLAYIAPCSMYYSALADYIAAITDEFSGDFSTCPGAVRMEHMLLAWMAELVGYPETSRGSLASGGSIATLTCMVTAREAADLKARDYEKVVVYLSEHTHHCIEKALHIAGMGECIIRRVAMDKDHRIDPNALEETITADRNEGLLPWLLVGSSGTTDLGNIDPLDALADVAERYKLWYHIDGAYGGFFILSDLVKDKFQGIERSDSVVMNPHKALYTPFGLGAALIRDGEKLYKAHHHTANYLQDSYLHQEEVSPADIGPELTRHFRAVRLWLPLKLIGVAPFRAALSEKILLTRYAYERMQDFEGFELGSYPELTVFTFRYLPANGEPDEFNRKLIETIRQDGTILLSSTLINGKYMIRFTVLSYRTHIDTVDLAIDIIQQHVNKLL